MVGYLLDRCVVVTAAVYICDIDLAIVDSATVDSMVIECLPWQNGIH